MRVNIPYDFTDVERAAVARFRGYDRPATPAECVAWSRQLLRSHLVILAAVPVRPRTVLGAPLE